MNSLVRLTAGKRHLGSSLCRCRPPAALIHGVSWLIISLGLLPVHKTNFTRLVIQTHQQLTPNQASLYRDLKSRLLFSFITLCGKADAIFIGWVHWLCSFVVSFLCFSYPLTILFQYRLPGKIKNHCGHTLACNEGLHHLMHHRTVSCC